MAAQAVAARPPGSVGFLQDPPKSPVIGEDQTIVFLKSILDIAKQSSMERALAQFPNLTVLIATSDDDLHDGSLMEISQALQQAKANFSGFVYRRKSGRTENDEYSSVVDITPHGEELTFEGIVTAVKGLKLKSLEIDNLSENGKFEVTQVIDLPELETLKLISYEKHPSKEKIPHFRFKFLSRMGNLQNLTLEHFYVAVGPKQFSRQDHNPLFRLQSLTIEGDINAWDGFANMPHLKNLTVFIRHTLRPFLVGLSMADLPELETISVIPYVISENNQLALFYLRPRPKLQSFIIYHCPQQFELLSQEVNELKALIDPKIELRLFPRVNWMYHPLTGNAMDKNLHEASLNLPPSKEKSAAKASAGDSPLML